MLVVMRVWPPTPPLMHMRWHELAFLHWPVAAETLEPHIPAPLRLDTKDGQAWLAVVPFRMSGIRGHMLPEVPGASRFLELNVRTYVTDGEHPGVWFFSLEANHGLAVRAARLGFHLPYMDAHITQHQHEHWWHYRSVRTHWREPSAVFMGQYRPSGAVIPAAAGSLEHWLTERYCLYSSDRHGRVYRGDIRHVPWPLQACDVELEHNTMAESLGIRLVGPPLAHYAERLDVEAWGLRGVVVP
jgi:uncharacterized protein